MNFLLNFWWRMFPSTNIKVYYRMEKFVQNLPEGMARDICLKTALEKCSTNEQKFILRQF